MSQETTEGSVTPDSPPESHEGRKEGSSRKEAMAALHREVERLQKTASRAIMVAGAAIVVAVTSPLWSPSLLGALGTTDPVTARVLVLAVEQLRPALSSSAPFEHEITVARRIMSDDREMIRALDDLAAAAPVGVPTLDAIRGQFVTLANGIFAAELFGLEPSERRLDRAVVRVASVMRLHDLARALEVNTAGPSSALVAQAAHRLAGNDLPGTIAALERLPERYAPLIRPWINAAQTRLKVARVLEMLDSRAARMPVSFSR